MEVKLPNGVELRFGLAGGLLQGLTQATVDGLPLIAPESARLPYLETRDSWQVTGYRVSDARLEDEGVVLEAQALGTKTGMGRKIDVFESPYITTPRRNPVTLGTFRWHIAPATVTLGHPAMRQNTYHGFSYRYEFELERTFHCILDSGTWEVGGDPEGVRMISQRMNPAAGPLDFIVSHKGRCFSSAESFLPGAGNDATTVPDVPADPSMGFILPIQAQLRGAGGALVDVQYKGQGILICYYEQADYYRTLIEWRPDDVGIGHLDHHFFPLTRSYITPAKTILAAKSPDLTHADALNRWTDAWEHVASAWRRQTGLSRVEPIMGLGLDCCGSVGRHHGSGPTDLFDRWERRFDWMRGQAMEYIFIGGIGHHRGEELPGAANMCQPYDYSARQRYGGPERFGMFCQRAHAHGLKVILWMNGALSDWAPALKAHPEWTLAYDSGMPWDGGYRILRCCSLRKGFGQWLLEQFRRLKDLGLDGLFFDSYHNLAAMCIDFGDPTLTPQLFDLWKFQAQCENLGLQWLIESTGPLGVTSCGLWPQYTASPELNYWTHYRAILHGDRGASDLRNDHLTPNMFFRMLANKAPIGFTVFEQANAPFEGLPNLPEPYPTMQRLYRDVHDMMQVRTIHEDGSIAWADADGRWQLLFAVDSDRVTVPPGHLAKPLFGIDRTLSAGTHDLSGIAAWRLTAI
ncbi:MAG TPA: hypothetical protein DCX07_00445 [Phycisphaerales bacterium]|nr:hypothetical protein [Phycisphaerales bacterium]